MAKRSGVPIGGGPHPEGRNADEQNEPPNGRPTTGIIPDAHGPDGKRFDILWNGDDRSININAARVGRTPQQAFVDRGQGPDDPAGFFVVVGILRAVPARR